MSRITAVVSLLIVVLAARGAAAVPQAGPEPAEAAATPTPVAAIPAADVLSEAEETAADLRRIVTAKTPVDDVQTVADALAREAPRFRDLRAGLDAVDVDRVSTRRVEDQQIAWAERADRVDEWAERLEDRWKALQEMRDQLERRRLQWQRTRGAADQERFPAELAERIDAVLADIDEADDAVRARSETIARLTDRVSALRATASAARERLDVLAERIRRRLLVRDAPPVWAIGSTPEPVALAEEARQAHRYWLGTLLGWLEERPGSLVALLGLFAVALASTLTLSRRSGSWAPDETLAAARAVVGRPVASATAFALLVLALLGERLPGPVDDVALAVAVFPVLSLGSVLVGPALRPVLYWVAALALVERASALGPDGSLLHRLLVLVVAAVAGAGAAMLLRRWRARGPAGWHGLVPIALNGAVALLVVSVTANLLGWVTLAESLGSATVATGFAAISWLVAARAAQALVPLVPGGAPGRWLPSVRRHARGFQRITRLLIAAVAVVSWGRGTLERFQVSDALWGWLADVLTAPLGVGGLEFSLGRVLSAIAVLLLVIPMSRAVLFALREEVLPRVALPAGADNSVMTLTRYAVLGGGAVLAAGVAGLGATELTVVFGALGVGIGFGLQNVVNNFVSGLILIFERPIKVGDRVETAQHLGVVARIGIRASTVRTFDGAEVVVPNGDLISKELINWTLSDQVRRVDLRVGVAYGSDPTRVIEVLKERAAGHPRVLQEPEPAALMIGFGDSSLDFRLLAWVRVEDYLAVSSQLHVAVTEALADAGIEIPFPQRDLHVRSLATPVPIDPSAGYVTNSNPTVTR